MGARAITMVSATDIRTSDARTLYKQLNDNQPSPSGQTPHSLEWYIERPSRQFHASLLLSLYKLALQNGIAHSQAFVWTYHTYYWLYRGKKEAPGTASQRIINTERAFYLIRRAKDLYGNSPTSHGEKIAVQECKLCGAEILTFAHEANFVCSVCSGGRGALAWGRPAARRAGGIRSSRSFQFGGVLVWSTMHRASR
ncbi:FlhC family transcriptional regulator [Cupriavidus sp. USMAA2-4]|uniref:FlhC family transcriptional regulator n=1 Tax=Cupriavidus sp. USMAA2-4 TaxID=876364 RepID=UPI000A05538B|nr:FlhC family transcriptional regulator [Cupriavidus sp. USMAA2-4]